MFNKLKVLPVTLSLGLILCTFASTAQSAEVESSAINSESRMQISEIRPEISKFNLNVQIGASALDLSGDSAKSRNKQGLASSLSLELGNISRFLETGLLFYQSKSEATIAGTKEELSSSYLGIPMMAKFYTNGGSNGLYIKGGMITSFLLDSSNDSGLRNVDLIGSLGVGGKMNLSQKSDFLIEATYNRGFLDQLSGSGDTFQQGFVILAGMAFRI